MERRTQALVKLKLLRNSLLLCLFTGSSEAQCDGCLEYCCDGAPPFCCSYYAYVGDVLSGTAISGIVFGVVFLMGAAAAFFLCVCMCVKNGRGARVGVFSASYVNTVSQGYPGPPPPYDYEMYPPALRPPPLHPDPAAAGQLLPTTPLPGPQLQMRFLSFFFFIFLPFPTDGENTLEAFAALSGLSLSEARRSYSTPLLTSRAPPPGYREGERVWRGLEFWNISVRS